MIKKILIFTTILLIGSFTYALPANETLAKKLNSVITFSSDFTQTVEDDHDQVLQKSTGHMQFNRPLLFYWHTDSPHPQTLWYRKHELIIYDQRLQQATIKKISTTTDPNLLPLMLLTGNAVQVLQHFTVTETNGDYTLKPISHDSGLLIGVLLKITPQGSIQEIEYQTSLGQKTIINFNHADVNKPLNQSLFFERIPTGVDIVGVE